MTTKSLSGVWACLLAALAVAAATSGTGAGLVDNKGCKDDEALEKAFEDMNEVLESKLTSGELCKDMIDAVINSIIYDDPTRCPSDDDIADCVDDSREVFDKYLAPCGKYFTQDGTDNCDNFFEYVAEDLAETVEAGFDWPECPRQELQYLCKYGQGIGEALTCKAPDGFCDYQADHVAVGGGVAKKAGEASGTDSDEGEGQVVAEEDDVEESGDESDSDSDESNSGSSSSDSDFSSSDSSGSDSDVEE